MRRRTWRERSWDSQQAVEWVCETLQLLVELRALADKAPARAVIAKLRTVEPGWLAQMPKLVMQMADELWRNQLSTGARAAQLARDRKSYKPKHSEAVKRRALFRLSAGLTQAEVANDFGVSDRTLRNWKRAEMQLAQLKKRQR
jgi:hypothetical protein